MPNEPQPDGEPRIYRVVDDQEIEAHRAELAKSKSQNPQPTKFMSNPTNEALLMQVNYAQAQLTVERRKRIERAVAATLVSPLLPSVASVIEHMTNGLVAFREWTQQSAYFKIALEAVTAGLVSFFALNIAAKLTEILLVIRALPAALFAAGAAVLPLTITLAALTAVIVAVAQAWGLYKDKQNEALSAKNTQSALTGYGEAIQQTIEAGRKTFVEVGLALAEIRDARLYRSDFDTFEEIPAGQSGTGTEPIVTESSKHHRRLSCCQLATNPKSKLNPKPANWRRSNHPSASRFWKRRQRPARSRPPEMDTVVSNQRQARELSKVPTENRVEAYCQKKWGWSEKRASHLIIASEVVKTLPTQNSTIVENEGQARQLAKVPIEKRVEVLTVAQEAGPVTAKTIHEAAAIVAPRPDNKPLRQDPFRLTVDAVKEQVAQIIRHRPAKKNQLLTCSKVLAQAAKKLAAFAKKAKD